MDSPNINGCVKVDNLSFLNSILFRWIQPLLKECQVRTVGYESVYSPPAFWRAQATHAALLANWEEEMASYKGTGRQPSLRRAIFRTFWKPWVILFIPSLIWGFATLLSPILSFWVIQYFEEGSDVSMLEAYLYAAGIVVCNVYTALVHGWVTSYKLSSCFGIRPCLISLIYSKMLTNEPSTSLTHKKGMLLDLIGNDTTAIAWHAHYLNYFVSTPLEITIGFVVIWYTIGLPALVGLIALLVILSFLTLLANMEARYVARSYKYMDERVGIIGEIINGMRIIKMYCWEKPYGCIVNEIRKKEMHFLWLSHIFNALSIELIYLSTKLLLLVVVTGHVINNGVLVASTIFPMFMLFGIITRSLIFLSSCIRKWIVATKSTKRIEDFLMSERNSTKCADIKQSVNIEETTTLQVNNISGSWSLVENIHDVSTDSTELTLNNISCELSAGECLAVIGKVGSGKSSLLLSICGEFPLSEGSVQCCGRLAYVAQEPWIFSASLRQNITFCEEYDETWYTNVVKACQLEGDLMAMPHGDDTLVGEKGVTLSGGQKARVALARAVYSKADVYVLDDPLSALDAAVGAMIVKRCIRGLLKDKTVVLATHQLQYLETLENILLLEKGGVAVNMKWNEMLKEKCKGFMTSPSANRYQEDTRTIEGKQNKINFTCVEPPKQKEEVTEGRVSSSTYYDYVRAGSSPCSMLLTTFICCATQAVYHVGDWWLAVWSDYHTMQELSYMNKTDSSKNFTTTPFGNQSTNSTSNQRIDKQWFTLQGHEYLPVYIGLALLMYVMGFVRTASIFKMAIRSSTNLHNRMYKAVTRSPILFCDTTPNGQIMNRFSADTARIDRKLPEGLAEYVSTLFIVLGTFVTLILLNYFVIIAILPVIAMYFFLRRYYLSAQHQLQSLIASGFSIVISHITSTVEGIHSIRTYQVHERMVADLHGHLDSWHGTFYTYCAVWGWYTTMVNTINLLFSTTVIFGCLICHSQNILEIPPGEIALIFSYVLTLNNYIYILMAKSINVENEMVLAKRVLRYTNLSPEAKLETDSDIVSLLKSWPTEGQITFDNVSFAYSSAGKYVLKNVSFVVSSKEKIGIIGRTGAGKSSIVECMLRMAEADGDVKIDNVNLKQLGLHAVRGALTVIPQDPVLFSGTIRHNVDPFEEFMDSDIWKVLEQVHLKSAVFCHTEGLGLLAKVSGGGNNFSVGQKQLFCLARALLRKSKILVLDEATANVDHTTDELIQKTIRDNFSDCTVLTIAHRLNTVMDADRIMVVEGGKIAEFDKPDTLMKEQGFLYRLTLASAQ